MSRGAIISESTRTVPLMPVHLRSVLLVMRFAPIIVVIALAFSGCKSSSTTTSTTTVAPSVSANANENTNNNVNNDSSSQIMGSVNTGGEAAGNSEPSSEANPASETATVPSGEIRVDAVDIPNGTR